ncbi:hypothetical protein NEOC65_001171 [Neochlamydia sp. AcF65]|nr:hypothetical protein [Neochlamydia sp. AcF65]
MLALFNALGDFSFFLPPFCRKTTREAFFYEYPHQGQEIEPFRN